MLTEQGGDTREDSKEATDITSLPGYELLSEKERKLCLSMGISPNCYITFKTVVLKFVFSPFAGPSAAAERRRGQVPLSGWARQVALSTDPEPLRQQRLDLGQLTPARRRGPACRRRSRRSR